MTSPRQLAVNRHIEAAKITSSNLVRPILCHYKIQKTGESIKSNFYQKIFFSALFFAIILLAFFITRPFLPALFTGAIIAYLVYPLYKKTSTYIKNKNLLSFLAAAIIILIVAVPFVLVIGLVSKEAYGTYTTLSQHNVGANFLKITCKDENSLPCKAVKSFVRSLPEGDIDYYMQATIKKITGFIIDNASDFAASIPSILLNFFIMIFVVYYLLKDGEAIGARIKSILPLKEHHKRNVLKKFHDVTSAVFYGNLLIAAIQGALGGIGFFMLGIPSPFLWGIVMALFALIPYFGTAIVWLPAALNLIFMGYLQSNNSLTIRGILLIAYGVLVISSIDNLLKPKIIGAKARVHPILVLLGVLGGLSLFGFIGLILGPVMLALLMTFVDIYEEEKSELEKYF